MGFNNCKKLLLSRIRVRARTLHFCTFCSEPSEESVVVKSEGLSALAITVCAIGTLALGVFPGPVLSLLEKIVILIP